MNQDLRDELVAGLAALDAGETSADDLISWAMGALQQGYDSPSLRVLASLLPGEADAADMLAYARRAATEHRIELPEGEDLRRAYISVACRALLRGHLDPELALDRIHGWVVSPLGHPRDLMRWCYLWEGNGPECEFLEEPNTRYVIAEARRWLDAEAITAADAGPK